MKVTILFYLLAFAAIASANHCVCPAGKFQFKLDVYTDDYAYESSWRLIRNSNGAQIFSNPSLSDFTLYSKLVCLDNGSYTFRIDDTYGDGLCCGYGHGWYKGYVYGSQIFSGGAFAYTDSRTFSGTSTCPASPSSKPSASPSVSPTASPSSHIAPWLVGPTIITKVEPNNGVASAGDSYFDGALNITNMIGSRVNDDVLVELFDYQCINEKVSSNASNTVQITYLNGDPSNFWYLIQIEQSNIGSDTEGFVFPDIANPLTGDSTGSVKFCTRVSTQVGSIQVAFRETNFVLNYDLTDNNFNITSISIQSNDPDSFITAVDSDFSVAAYQCNNYVKTVAHTLRQDENLVICLEPQHPGNMAHVVHISNFDIKMYAGSSSTVDYVEYNPVWFSTGGWQSDTLTVVSEQHDPAGIVMITTPIIAQFFIQGHAQINVSGNCFLEFHSAKETRAPAFVNYEMQFGVVDLTEEGCLVGLIRRIRAFF